LAESHHLAQALQFAFVGEVIAITAPVVFMTIGSDDNQKPIYLNEKFNRNLFMILTGK
jgi:hypothetical protein